MSKIRFTLSLQKLNATIVNVGDVQCAAIPLAMLNPFEFNGIGYFCLDAVETPNSAYGKSHFIKTCAPKGVLPEQVRDFTVIVGSGKNYDNGNQQSAQQILPNAPQFPTAQIPTPFAAPIQVDEFSQIAPDDNGLPF